MIRISNFLFWQFLRAVEEINPKIVLFENVSGFKKLYKSIAFNILKQELNKFGYQVKTKILNAADYGAPQHRKRTIVVGFKKGIDFHFPVPTHTQEGDMCTKKYNTLSIDPEFVDASYLYINPTVKTRYNPDLTTISASGVQTKIINAISTFESNNLGTFDNERFRYRIESANSKPFTKSKIALKLGLSHQKIENTRV